MAALTASTNVNEGRRSDRSNALSYIMRPFNRISVLEVENIREEEASTNKKTIDRVEGRQLVQMFANHCDAFNSGITGVCSEKYQQLLETSYWAIRIKSAA